MLRCTWAPLRNRHRTRRHRPSCAPLPSFPGRLRVLGAATWLLLGLTSGACLTSSPPSERPLPLSLPRDTRPEIASADLAAHVAALTDERTEGRLAGTAGERIAADYLARVYAAIGLEPEGETGQFTNRFEFTSGVALGPTNSLELTANPDEAPVSFAVDRDWRPIAFSRGGEVEPTEVVFAGYGLVAPEHAGAPAIDDYRDAAGERDVRDKWVMVFRDLPQSLEGERRQGLQLHASLRYKAMVARDRGARGVLFVSGPLGRFRNELIPLRFDASLAGTGVAVVSLSDAAAQQILGTSGRGLETLQARAEARITGHAGMPEAGGRLAGHTAHAAANTDPADSALRHAPGAQDEAGSSAERRLAARIDLETLGAEGVNVIGRLRVGDEPSAESIVIGAHYDHLGHGEGSSSLASGSEMGKIHPGADDNASGTALVIEIAQALAEAQRAGGDIGQRDFIFAAWSGEELGLLGSDAWLAQIVHPHSEGSGPIAYFNFDMVGRLTGEVVIQGLGSSPDWAPLLESASEKSPGLKISTQQDSYLPTDATSFYTRGIPILSAFTGVHSEYHTPLDTADRLNLAGTAEIGELFAELARQVSRRESPPDYQAQKAPAAGQGRGGFRVFLGTIPDYAQTDVTGVRLSGVAPSGPAEQAGLRRGDIIVRVDGRPIENLYDYTYALEALRVGVPAQIEFLRDGAAISVEVVPSSRD